MTRALLLSVLIGYVVSGCTAGASAQTGVVQTKEPGKAGDLKPVKFAPLTDEQLTKLLARRTDGGAGGLTFRQFANMFLVASRLNLGEGVGLMTESKEIADAELTSTCPGFYRPTLREFLDAIALQTGSQWSHETTGKFIQSDVPSDKPISGMAIFEFKKVARKKPYEVKLAEGWKTVDHGNWVMHVPPTFPVGMDIYELGAFSTDKEDKDKFRRELPYDVSLDWAQKVNEKAKLDDLKTAKVGEYDAVFYEAMIPTQIGKDIRWRQWVFTADDRCYFVVSTILPDLEDKIFPDVEKMLSSFKLQK